MRLTKQILLLTLITSNSINLFALDVVKIVREATGFCISYINKEKHHSCIENAEEFRLANRELYFNRTFKGNRYLAIPFVSSIQQSNDDGYIVAGSIDFNAWVIKLNSLGDKEWDKTFVGSGFYLMASIQQSN
ncbi:hypothetical protein MJH12_08680, partial [bacterium]|nr:hypothetical protein [bacterium]